MRWALWIGYWVFLFIIMHTPVVGTGRFHFNYADKVVHFGLYAWLTWMGAWCLSHPTGRLDTRAVLFWAAIYVVYGALDEYLQQFVGRTTDVLDWLADTAGVASATAFLWVKNRKLSEPVREV